MSEQKDQDNRQMETYEESTEALPNISIAMISFEQQNDAQIQNIENIENKENKSAIQYQELEQQNQKLQEQNQKLYQQLSQTENKLNFQIQKVEELTQERIQNIGTINELKKIVDQQRDFINQINDDQAYTDLTESLELSLQKLKEMEQKNEKLLEENLYYKTKYEESLIFIKNNKEETLNQQDRIDQLSQNYQQSSEGQLEKIKVLEQEINKLHDQLQNN
ncbi:unnamed protein product [Paramecium sonneborni]|uniref:Uncharacterized protein n=1 Tax=Paramecium sonneborni TaxID=65129 RepID=A0A8S1MX01_9CILI|nr:unnamed protein product [Paramecium sonneborni]